MPFLDSLFARWGFVKLSRYGLRLTPEGRIISIRPMVLDDGIGGRVVGWQDQDLAAAELQTHPVLPAPARAIAAPVAVPRPVSPPVARAPQVDEDEWEWTIALARARAAAEESMAAARLAATKTLPLPAPRESAEWPATVPAGGVIDYNDYTDPVTARAASRAGSPGTVIPVPRLPRLEATTPGTRVPVGIRAAPPPVPVAARRFPKGTGPVLDATRVGVAPAPPPPVPITMIDEPTIDDRTAPALLIGDRTTPGMAALPSIRSRSAR